MIKLLLAVSAPGALLLMLRPLLTVTHSADQHHITQRLMLFPADRRPRKTNTKAVRNAAFLTKSPSLLYFFLENFVMFVMQLCLTFWLISY